MNARRGILDIVAEINYVARGCKLAGVSRSRFYAMKKAYKTYGKEGLALRVRLKPNKPNRTPARLEEQIPFKTRGNQVANCIRLAAEIMLEGIRVTSSVVRYFWQRHRLSA